MATQNGTTAANLPVLIIGAGSCGLAVANGLKRAGISYKVLEKDDSVKLRSDGKERDWAVACHWSSPILAELIGPEKWSRILEVQVDPNTPTPELDVGKVLNGATGEVINELPFPKFYRFLRSRLRALISESIDISYGKKLSSLSYADDGTSVTAYFEDGTSEKGRLVIGADGSNSKVRRLLVGAEKAKLKQLPFNATFINASFTREQALFLRSYHPLATVIVHPDNMMSLLALLDAPDADKPEGWRFCFYISWGASVEEQEAEAAVMGARERLTQAKEKSKVYADPLKSAHAWLPDDHEAVYWTRNMNWDPSLPEHAWENHSGLVTLAGDAAHPMTYHRGQGLNHALDDAGKIVKLLSTSKGRSQSEIIDVYETEMRARAGEEVRLSEMNSRMLHDFSRLQESPLMKRSLAKGSIDNPQSEPTETA
ncbi:hypothetical protein BKA67DRAFT_656932 [Truncatella angustata]|uniref:FAD-binding domain-containing protein n=1 Tax=Truncatella angustata TaxID=152316 RepID=A0A9P8UMK8_9PEZI|nr:uncharacterized protein BKA67DRAFT_656932 [Truncatella angustata]KAH6654962.1 hypothetical protein BKA67DRAFT_656932 [Truncatella angustata]KAH8204058.1 hypothetical protein TruAng_001740 [Truncatella angustata]